MKEKSDYRHHCGRLLFRGWLPAGSIIETRCPKCGRMYVVEINQERKSYIEVKPETRAALKRFVDGRDIDEVIAGFIENNT